MKITILKYDHRHGCDLSAHATHALANKARAEICAKRVDDRIYVYPRDAADEGETVGERVKSFYDAGQYDECVDLYLEYNTAESFDIEEVEVQGLGTLLSARELKQLEELLAP